MLTRKFLTLFFLLTAFAAPPALAQDAAPRTRAVTASYTDRGEYDVYACDASSAAVTITLQSPAKRRRVEVVKTDTSANACTVATAGTGATVNGATTFVLQSQHEGAAFVSNGLSGSSGVWRAVSNSELGTNTVQVSLTAAQIKDLADTPVSLVAAPGAGKVIEFVSAVLLLDHAGTGFTESADNLEIHYENEAGAAVSEAIECTGFIDQTADTMTTARAKLNQIVAKSGSENKALVLVNPNDDFGDGGTTTSVLRVKVTYRVHVTGW